MRFVADLHIHSRFSIATSRKLTPEHLDYWARVKGIAVVGTGDFTHPGWLAELEEKLVPGEEGLHALSPALRAWFAASADALELPAPEGQMRFLLTAEVSTIYKRGGRTRKVHHVLVAPTFASARRIHQRLDAIGNVRSDGRPILGVDSRDVLAIVLEGDDGAYLIPAHIWTSWFSALGGKSGFDTIEDCYGELTEHIFAVETGLSSDPPMNWLCSRLDRYTLVSNSDAHSPENLGREANVFDAELSYDGIRHALETGARGHDRATAQDTGQSTPGDRLLETVEFFPQEGKYHYDGHRACGVRLDPVQSAAQNGTCPVCGKKVTIGVMHRVMQLADRGDPAAAPNRGGFRSLIPLKELLAEILQVGSGSKRVARAYRDVIFRLGPELAVLIDAPTEEIAAAGSAALAEAVSRMRDRRVYVEEGYDGAYGTVRVFDRSGPGVPPDTQESLFPAGQTPEPRNPPPSRPLVAFDPAAFGRSLTRNEGGSPTPGAEHSRVGEPAQGELFPATAPALSGLNDEQVEATAYDGGPALVIAGPGTGKTRVLTRRIAYLVVERGVPPDRILALTFTNKAAREMRDRLEPLLGIDATRPTVQTFHAFGYGFLEEYHAQFGRDRGFGMVDDEDKARLLAANGICSASDTKDAIQAISRAKQALRSPVEEPDDESRRLYALYDAMLQEENAFDLDDLLYLPVSFLGTDAGALEALCARFPVILVDEYQDVNAAQYSLLRLLAPEPTANLFVIGDPNQAIYGFRGADVGYIRHFVADYPAARVFRLSRSYRCSSTILTAAGGVLGSHEAMLRGLDPGVRIRVARQPTDRGEAELVARTIERMIGGLRFFSMDSAITNGEESSVVDSLGDIAVLCRLTAQMPYLAKAFRDHAIPYQRVGERSLLAQEPVRTVVDLVRYAAQPHHAQHRLRLSRRGVRDAVLEQARQELAKVPSVEGRMRMAAGLLGSDSGPGRDELERVFAFAAAFGTDIPAFLRHGVLDAGADTFVAGREEVALMTMHASKGLEFDCVFVVGCEDGIVPFTLDERRAADPEEERRLFYVAMTRAKRHLVLTGADRRRLYGRTYRLPQSRFVDRIEQELLDAMAAVSRSRQDDEKQLSLF